MKMLPLYWLPFSGKNDLHQSFSHDKKMRKMNRSLTIAVMLLILPAIHAAPVTRKQVMYLSGKGYNDTREWDFFCTGGRNSNRWTKIEVPSFWEEQGFGILRNADNESAGATGPGEEKGLYRYSFELPPTWKGKSVNIVFEGSMTDTEVKINGIAAGETHRGGFSRFSYDITGLLSHGKENLLEVIVSKPTCSHSPAPGIREPGFSLAGGIYKPVYLEAYPEEHVGRIDISAGADGSFAMNIFPVNIRGARILHADIVDKLGKKMYSSDVALNPADSMITFRCKVDSPMPWTNETPVLYNVIYSLKSGKKILHESSEHFGFRSIAVSDDNGILVNGRKTALKTLDIASYFTRENLPVDRRTSANRIKLLKEMNFNAVRIADFVPDNDFLNNCDSMGLYIIETVSAPDMYEHAPSCRNAVLELINGDDNHPSVILRERAVRNEPGSETAREANIHDTSGRVASNALRETREGLSGIIDTCTIDVPGSLTDIIKERTGRYHAFRRILSPVLFAMDEINPDFSGSIAIENRFTFMNLSECLFIASFVSFPPAAVKPGVCLKEKVDTLASPFVIPGEKGVLNIDLPDDWKNYDGLTIKVIDPYNNNIAEQTWQLRNNSMIIRRFIDFSGKRKADITESDTIVTLGANDISVTFSKKTGKMIGAVNNSGVDLMFPYGPVLPGCNYKLTNIKSLFEEDGTAVEAEYQGDVKVIRWKLHDSGWLSLDCEYNVNNGQKLSGLLFSFPEDEVTGVKWLGRWPVPGSHEQLICSPFGLWSYTTGSTRDCITAGNESTGIITFFTWMRLASRQRELLIATGDKELIFSLPGTPGSSGGGKHEGPGTRTILFPDTVPGRVQIDDANAARKHKLWFYPGIAGTD
jgi:hypothetical protein